MSLRLQRVIRKGSSLQRDRPDKANATDRRPPRLPADSVAADPAGYVISGHRIDASALAPGLYIVATPIGNLGDMTLRGLETLAAADLVLCEDTRVTRRLLDRYGIRARTDAFHEHNAASRTPRILDELRDGRTVALVSDAGTPLISDPGQRLVAAARSEDLPVHVVPGPSALTAALSVAGLPVDAVHFAGFLPAKAGARRSALEALAAIPATLAVYEAPHRLCAALGDMQSVFGDREAAVCRELTKLHEEVTRGTLSEIAENYSARETVKGEIVILVAAPTEDTADFDLDAALAAALEHQSMRDAVAEVTALSGLPRKAVYNRALEIKGDRS